MALFQIHKNISTHLCISCSLYKAVILFCYSLIHFSFIIHPPKPTSGALFVRYAFNVVLIVGLDSGIAILLYSLVGDTARIVHSLHGPALNVMVIVSPLPYPVWTY